MKNSIIYYLSAFSLVCTQILLLWNGFFNPSLMSVKALFGGLIMLIIFFVMWFISSDKKNF